MHKVQSESTWNDWNWCAVFCVCVYECVSVNVCFLMKKKNNNQQQIQEMSKMTEHCCHWLNLRTHTHTVTRVSDRCVWGHYTGPIMSFMHDRYLKHTKWPLIIALNKKMPCFQLLHNRHLSRLLAWNIPSQRLVLRNGPFVPSIFFSP